MQMRRKEFARLHKLAEDVIKKNEHNGFKEHAQQLDSEIKAIVQ